MRRIVGLALTVMLVLLCSMLYVQREGDAAVPSLPEVNAVVDKAKPPAPAPRITRPLRTMALGWELLAPGVLAKDTGKATPAELELANATTMEEIETALAKGGEGGGADVAIVPLSSYVASYERLRALAPEIVFVVGWSRGREAVFASEATALGKLPASGPVKMVGTAGKPETFLALYALELAGVPANRLELVDKPTKGGLAAVQRGTAARPAGKLLITSADTPTLLPIVAIVPHGFAQAHPHDLEAWGRAWLAGVSALAADVPGGARKVAALPGAPAVLNIIEALGQVELANLRANAMAFGMSGRGALTLDTIFAATWKLWRDTGVLTTPAPEAAPIDPTIVATLVRSEPATTTDAPAPTIVPPSVTAPASRPAVLLTVKLPAGKLEAEAFVARVGLVAAVFGRLPLRIGVADGAKTGALLADMTRERFGLRAGQLTSASRPAVANASATIEVLSR